MIWKFVTICWKRKAYYNKEKNQRTKINKTDKLNYRGEICSIIIDEVWVNWHLAPARNEIYFWIVSNEVYMCYSISYYSITAYGSIELLFHYTVLSRFLCKVSYLILSWNKMNEIWSFFHLSLLVLFYFTFIQYKNIICASELINLGKKNNDIFMFCWWEKWNEKKIIYIFILDFYFNYIDFNYLILVYKLS